MFFLLNTLEKRMELPFLGFKIIVYARTERGLRQCEYFADKDELGVNFS